MFREKTFFFGVLSGPPRDAGTDGPLDGADDEDAERGLFGTDPADLRPARPVSRSPATSFPAAASTRSRSNILQQLYPEPNTAGSRAANGQVINNYLINPIKERQDNQGDFKVDHNLSTANRFFVRYSFDKTHRLQPASLPHGDAGFTFGAGDGNIKAQSLAFNDTHVMSSKWLNEFRFGWSSIKFFMTPIDYLHESGQRRGASRHQSG